MLKIIGRDYKMYNWHYVRIVRVGRYVYLPIINIYKLTKDF